MTLDDELMECSTCALWELQKADLVAGTPKVARDFSRYWRV